MKKNPNHDYTEKYEFIWERNKDGGGCVSYLPNGEEALLFEFNNKAEEVELEGLCKSIINTFDFSFNVGGDIEDARNIAEISLRNKEQ